METSRKMEYEGTRGERVRYLDAEEKQRTRALWMECFPEDTEAFVSYYYKEKAKNNRILAKMDGRGAVTMLHRNPYRIRLKNKEWRADYIVGVATRRDRRRQGHMGEVLLHCLRDMNREHMPFAFLMPAAEAIYHPYSFRYVEQQQTIALDPARETELARMEAGKGPKEDRAIGAFMTRWLEERYEMSTVRDEAYVRNLRRELESEDGRLDCLFHRGKCVGLQAFWGIREREQRILYAQEEWCMKGAATPRMMARITDVTAFLPAFCLSGEGELVVELELLDEQIPENGGCFLWRLTGQGSAVERISGRRQANPAGRIRLRTDIAKLAEWLFGYKKAGELWGDGPGSPADVLRPIQTIRGILLDEIV